MNLTSWILFGMVIGIIANNIDEHHQNQIVGWIAVSILGAVVGGLIGSLIFGVSPFTGSFNIQSFVVAFLISTLLLVGMEMALPKAEQVRVDKRLYGMVKQFHHFNLKIHHGAFRKI